MPRARGKYPTHQPTEEDLLQALVWLDERVSGACFDTRLVRPRTGAGYLQVSLVGFRRAHVLGKPSRLRSEARWPVKDGRTLLAIKYGLVYTLAEEAEPPADEYVGRYTELIPSRQA